MKHHELEDEKLRVEINKIIRETSHISFKEVSIITGAVATLITVVITLTKIFL